jgi:chromosome segregation ATPase
MNPFGPSNTGELAAYNAGEFNAGLRSRGEINGLVSKINALQNQVRALQTDLNVVVPNRDELAKCAWDLHYELEDAKKGIAVLQKALDEAYQMYDDLRANKRKALDGWKELYDGQTARLESNKSLLKAMIATASLLIEAAETGKSNSREYHEAKTVYEQMTGVWYREQINALDNPEFNQRFCAAIKALPE